MDQTQFEHMVARLEEESELSPSRYQIKVALLMLLGFGIMLLLLGFAGFALALLTGLGLAIVLTGGKAAILLLKLGKLLILLAVPCWMLIKSSVKALFTRFPPPEGIELKRRDAPELFAQIDAMRKQMHGPRFHQVLITNEMNASVVQRPLFGLFGFPRNYLILGLPLLESLSPAEALAVVAHEYGHLSGSHGRFGAFIYRLRNTWGTIHETSTQWSGWIAKHIRRLIEWYAPYFNAYTFVLARQNEYEADAASARLVGCKEAQSALKRVSVASAHYDIFMTATYDAVGKEPQPPQNLAMQWASLAPHATQAERAQEWLQNAFEREGHYSDTHPNLAQRLAALGLAANTSAMPAHIEGPTAAQSWLGTHIAPLRNAIQQAWYERIQTPWQERHQEVQKQFAHLDALRQEPEPTVGQRIEMLQLQIELEKELDHLPALVAFNAEHADHAVALYMEGCWRLDKDDAYGLALLDRAMELDGEAIKPACDKAYGFLLKKKDPRAESYAARWNERNDWEIQRAHQIGTLDLSHPLRPAELNAEQLAEVERILGQCRQSIAKAWIARRILPIDAGLETYVVGIELTWWARQRNKGAAIVQQLSAAPWPFHAHICLLSGTYAPLKKKLKKLNGAQIALRN